MFDTRSVIVLILLSVIFGFGAYYIYRSSSLTSTSKISKLPHFLFIIGLLLIAVYGVILCLFSVLLQIFLILKYWQYNPAAKQPKKLKIGIVLYVISVLLIGIGFHQFFQTQYSGGIHIAVGLVLGALTFTPSSIILLSVATTQKKRKK
jgi:hypothetical protein